MNVNETLELFSKRQAGWNNWANNMLKERPPKTNQKEWSEWENRATADFTQHVFEGIADFSEFTFPGPVLFRKVNFKKRVNFDGACFKGSVHFDDAIFEEAAFLWTIFEDDVRFNRATFGKAAHFCSSNFKGKNTRFNRVTFKDLALFDPVRGDGAYDKDTAKASSVTQVKGDPDEPTTFLGNAFFDEAIFEQATNFGRAKFAKGASFLGIQAATTFEMIEIESQKFQISYKRLL